MRSQVAFLEPGISGNARSALAQSGFPPARSGSGIWLPHRSDGNTPERRLPGKFFPRLSSATTPQAIRSPIYVLPVRTGQVIHEDGLIACS